MDRLRAKKPVKNNEKWSIGTITSINYGGRVLIEDDGIVELNLTTEIIKLFKSRVEGKVEGSEAWYISK